MTEDTESKTNWTPGPWYAFKDDDDTTWAIFKAEGDGALRALVWDIGTGDTLEAEDEANAHLMAASPLLYRRLDDLLTMEQDQPGECDDCEDSRRTDGAPCSWHALIADARDTLAAARGEQP